MDWLEATTHALKLDEPTSPLVTENSAITDIQRLNNINTTNMFNDRNINKKISSDHFTTRMLAAASLILALARTMKNEFT